ncbi:helix-turn-helix domain-containing protein [Nevskia sp.]|uniref:helix-turn-helix domain-containing protein n=1 Tax=Nevskia sp. TaxID=1929292 RepID=UPI0034579B47
MTAHAGAIDTPLCVTFDDAAARLQVSKRTIYRMVDDGDLATVYVRGAARISYNSLVAYVEGRSQQRKPLCLTAAKTQPSGGSATPRRTVVELASLLAQRRTPKPKP